MTLFQLEESENAMKGQAEFAKSTLRLLRPDFDSLLNAIREAGFDAIGPVVRDGAIVYDRIAGASDLPIGWTDDQSGGSYRLLKKRREQSLFDFAAGPHSWKKYLHPSTVTLWRRHRSDGSVAEAAPDAGTRKPYALVGVHACDLAAIGIQDRVLLNGDTADPIYRANRDGALIVAVNCSTPGGTCFCASMGTGPKVSKGFDIALTEISRNGDHYFVVETGSARGAEILKQTPATPSTADELSAANEVSVTAARKMGRSLDTHGLADILRDAVDAPRWSEVAKRCLNCANCTMVCPTCFCTNVEDTTDLTGDVAERRRVWDSCFTLGFTCIHGGTIRASGMSRYRQWLTHKLSTWHDQFGTAGCVGCGRCITWCPVGIDITEEARAIRAQAKATPVATDA